MVFVSVGVVVVVGVVVPDVSVFFNNFPAEFKALDIREFPTAVPTFVSFKPAVVAAPTAEPTALFTALLSVPVLAPATEPTKEPTPAFTA